MNRCLRDGEVKSVLSTQASRIEEKFQAHLPSFDQMGGTAETAVFAMGTQSHSLSLRLVPAATFLRCCLSTFFAARRCSISSASCGADDGPATEDAWAGGRAAFSFRFLCILLGFDGPESAIVVSMVGHESEVRRGTSEVERNLLADAPEI